MFGLGGSFAASLHIFERCPGRESKKGALGLQDVLPWALGQMCRVTTKSRGGCAVC